MPLERTLLREVLPGGHRVNKRIIGSVSYTSIITLLAGAAVGTTAIWVFVLLAAWLVRLKDDASAERHFTHKVIF